MPLKKTNGLYRGKVRIGVTQDGKPIDKFVSGKTVKELEMRSTISTTWTASKA